MAAGLDILHLPCFFGHADVLQWAGIWTVHQGKTHSDILTLTPMVQFLFSSAQATKQVEHLSWSVRIGSGEKRRATVQHMKKSWTQEHVKSSFPRTCSTFSIILNCSPCCCTNTNQWGCDLAVRTTQLSLSSNNFGMMRNESTTMRPSPPRRPACQSQTLFNESSFVCEVRNPLMGLAVRLCNGQLVISRFQHHQCTK